MQRIIFHVGDRKTGTSSIQRALVQGAWRCDSRALHYPTGPARPHHKWLASGFVRDRQARIDRQFARLAELIAAAPERTDVVVVSSETFQDVAPERLYAAIRQHLPEYAQRVEVLAYARPHAQRLLSSYAQMVKLGRFSGDLDAYCDRMLRTGRFAMAERFQRWREVFGARFTLRPMARDHLYRGDVVQDFFHHVLGGADFELKTIPSANESLSLADLALLRHFHALLVRQNTAKGLKVHRAALEETRKRIGLRLAEHLSSHPDGETPERLKLHAALAVRISAALAEDAARCDAAFFDGTPMQDGLRAAVETARPAPQSLAVEDHFPPATLRQIPVWMALVGDMARHAPKGWAPHFAEILNRSFRGFSEPVVTQTPQAPVGGAVGSSGPTPD